MSKPVAKQFRREWCTFPLDICLVMVNKDTFYSHFPTTIINKNDLDLTKSKSHWWRTFGGLRDLERNCLLLLVIHWPHWALRVLLVQMGCDDQHEDSPQNSTLCLQRSATNSRSESMCMLCVHWSQICVKESFSATFQCLSMLLTFYDPSDAWGVYRVWLWEAWPSWMSALTS